MESKKHARNANTNSRTIRSSKRQHTKNVDFITELLGNLNMLPEQTETSAERKKKQKGRKKQNIHSSLIYFQKKLQLVRKRLQQINQGELMKD